jgi:hypothetical protein
MCAPAPSFKTLPRLPSPLTSSSQRV